MASYLCYSIISLLFFCLSCVLLFHLVKSWWVMRISCLLMEGNYCKNFSTLCNILQVQTCEFSVWCCGMTPAWIWRQLRNVTDLLKGSLLISWAPLRISDLCPGCLGVVGKKDACQIPKNTKQGLQIGLISSAQTHYPLIFLTLFCVFNKGSCEWKFSVPLSAIKIHIIPEFSPLTFYWWLVFYLVQQWI